jgi:hypothetical protein
VPRIHFISSALEMTIFGLKMMVKSGIDFFVLKLNELLQSCCCPLQKMAVQQVSLKGLIQLKKKSGPIIFKPKCPFEGFSSLIK